MPQKTATATRYSFRSNYDNTQLYLLLSSIIRCILWISVNLRLCILLPLTGLRFLPGGIAAFYINVNASSAILDIVDHLVINSYNKPRNANNKISNSNTVRLILNLVTKTLITFILMNYPKIAKNYNFPLMLYFQSLYSSVLYFYHFYKVRIFNLNNLIKVTWLINLKRMILSFCYPIVGFAELNLIFLSLQFINYVKEEKEFDYYDLTEYSSVFYNVMRFAMVTYVPLFYMSFKGKMNDLWSSKPKQKVHKKE